MDDPVNNIPESDDREPICQDPELKAYPQPSFRDGNITGQLPSQGIMENDTSSNPDDPDNDKDDYDGDEGKKSTSGIKNAAEDEDKTKSASNSGLEIQTKSTNYDDSSSYSSDEDLTVKGVGEEENVEEAISGGNHMILTREELEVYSTIFEEYDQNQTGTVDRETLFAILARFGYPIGDNDLLLLVPCCGLSFSNSYSFQAVISIIEYFKIEQKNREDTRDIDLVWMQLGGVEKGFIKTDAIKDVIKQYNLPLDLDFLMKNQMGCTDEQIERQEITLDQLKALLREPDKF